MKVHTSPAWIWHWLSPKNLKELENYHYSGEDLSFLVELFLRDFWNWCMNYVPVWMAYEIISFSSSSIFLPFILQTQSHNSHRIARSYFHSLHCSLLLFHFTNDIWNYNTTFLLPLCLFWIVHLSIDG